jgi:Tfp pilus assembly protein PilX
MEIEEYAMKAHHGSEHQPAARTGRRNAARGVALVTTLLILLLLMALTLAMTIAVTSDTLINKYYRDARSSFYAADSGVNVARQNLINQITADVTIGASATTEPIPATESTTALSQMESAYASATSIVGGLVAGSWPSSFKIVSAAVGTAGSTGYIPPSTLSETCTPIYTGTPTNSGPYTCTNLPTSSAACGTGSGVCLTKYSYTFPYTLVAIGQSLASEQQVIEDSGTITVNVNLVQQTTQAMSFAGWGMFIDQFPECNGGDLVAGTITGPVFTNGAWTFGDSGTYTFTSKVGSVSSTFGYDFGNCYESANQSYKSGSTTIAPNFEAGVNLGANPVPLPGNSFAQKEAVVDGLGTTWVLDNYTTAQQDAAMNAALKDVNNNSAAYPTSGTTNDGVYLAYSQSTVSGVTTNTMTGGGIYVEGNADNIVMEAENPTVSGTVHSQEVYVITQGNTVTTITVDATSNTTTVGSKVGNGSTATTVIQGVPQILTGSSPAPATMLYVDGNIGNNNNNDGLTGPGQGVPAIENGQAITVVASGSIDVTGDILYQTEPVTTTQNQSVSNTLTTTPCCSGDPADTLIPYKTEPTSVLGIFTATGNVNLDNQQSNGNLEIDAAIATISTNGSGAIVNPGNAINTLTIVGGRIQNTIQNINTTTRNVDFDQRFAQGNFAPPWFPSTTITTSGTDLVNTVIPTVQRTFWQVLQ